MAICVVTAMMALSCRPKGHEIDRVPVAVVSPYHSIEQKPEPVNKGIGIDRSKYEDSHLAGLSAP